MAKYNLDTCVWRDFYEDRFSKLGSPLGKYATKLFIKILKNKDKIIFSDSLIYELKNKYKEKEIYDMLMLLKINNILEKVEVKKEEYEEAKKISEERALPLTDCLIAVQARNHQAIVISQDKHFLKNLTDIVKTITPQDLMKSSF